MMRTNTSRLWRGIAFLMIMVGCGSMLACTPVVRSRTLPPSVRSVYIPVMDNRTSESGLEELLTRAVQEEILADGRLNLVGKKEADAVVEIRLKQFNWTEPYFDSDSYAVGKTWEIEAELNIWENTPGRPLIGDVRKFETRHSYNDDPRTTTFNAEPFEKEQLARVFARDFVLELMTGEIEEDDGEPAGILSDHTLEDDDEVEAPRSRIQIP